MNGDDRIDSLRASLRELHPGGRLKFHGGYAIRQALGIVGHGRQNQKRMRRKIANMRSRWALYADGGKRPIFLRTYASPAGAAEAIVAFEDAAR